MKILIAEDEPAILATMQFRLKREGHEIFTAVNGLEAIQLITEQMPDLIITDIMMPFKTGIEVLSFAKRKNKNTRVIVLSLMGQESVIVEAFKLGADDYMLKPFSPNELAMRVSRLSVTDS
jgi:DNA-binding response OmpR family regulator